MKLTPLNHAQIKERLKQVPAWTWFEETDLRREFRFSNFKESVFFVGAVAYLAERADHHPDIDIRWDRVTLSLKTHDSGGVTEKDFGLAQEIDQWFLPSKPIGTV